jgi:hypothetical protein
MQLVQYSTGVGDNGENGDDQELIDDGGYGSTAEDEGLIPSETPPEPPAERVHPQAAEAPSSASPP